MMPTWANDRLKILANLFFKSYTGAMDYMAVSELKRSRSLWSRLSASKELILTRDGKPGALMVEVSSDNVEHVVTAVRRALFSEAVSQARARAEGNLNLEDDIKREIEAARE